LAQQRCNQTAPEFLREIVWCGGKRR